MKRVLYIAVIVLLLGVVAFSAYKLTEGFMEYRRIDDFYGDLDARYVTPQEIPAEPETAESRPMISAPEETGTAEQHPAEQIRNEGTTEAVGGIPITVDFEALMVDAPDVVGWLYGMGGEINLPVVQAEDNDYYLHRLPNGEYSSGGTLFVDYRCGGDFSDEITFIYGHNMKNGSMLEPITHYEDQAVYAEYPVMYLLTPEGNYRMELFSGFITDAYSDVYTFGFDDNRQRQEYVAMLNQQADFVPNREPEDGERILCLSTCTYEYDSARYVLFGLLTPCQ